MGMIRHNATGNGQALEIETLTDRHIDEDAISITRKHDGSWECATVHNNRLVHMRYYGYTKWESLRLFLEYLEGL